jgi:predicted metal-dependent hydrolase
MSEPAQLRLFDLLPRRRRKPAARQAGSAAPRSGEREEAPATRQTAPAAPRRHPRLRTQGRCCDLEELAREVKERYFDDDLTAGITWGRRRPRRRRRSRGRRVSMQLGSYHPEQDVVRIHPALDQPWVPRFVLEAVIYHELLHAALPPRVEGGRRRVHTPEFRRRERLFPYLERAQAWIEENLSRLLATA